jgi:hypothetical protein
LKMYRVDQVMQITFQKMPEPFLHKYHLSKKTFSKISPLHICDMGCYTVTITPKKLCSHHSWLLFLTS